VDANRLVLREWTHALSAEGKSPMTIRSYTESVRMLIESLDGAAALDASTDDLRRFIAHLGPGERANAFRDLSNLTRTGGCIPMA
jgi:hypothetical protein